MVEELKATFECTLTGVLKIGSLDESENTNLRIQDFRSDACGICSNKNDCYAKQSTN